jgi:hypothetical protein
MIRHAPSAGAVSRLTITVIGTTLLALLVAPIGFAAALAPSFPGASTRAVEMSSTARNALEKATLARWTNRPKDDQAPAPLPRTQRT